MEAARKRPEIGAIRTSFLPSDYRKKIRAVDQEKVLNKAWPSPMLPGSSGLYGGALFINDFTSLAAHGKL